jgi:hypothetical protein
VVVLARSSICPRLRTRWRRRSALPAGSGRRQGAMAHDAQQGCRLAVSLHCVTRSAAPRLTSAVRTTRQPNPESSRIRDAGPAIDAFVRRCRGSLPQRHLALSRLRVGRRRSTAAGAKRSCARIRNHCLHDGHHRHRNRGNQVRRARGTYRLVLESRPEAEASRRGISGLRSFDSTLDTVDRLQGGANWRETCQLTRKPDRFGRRSPDDDPRTPCPVPCARAMQNDTSPRSQREKVALRHVGRQCPANAPGRAATEGSLRGAC